LEESSIEREGERETAGSNRKNGKASIFERDGREELRIVDPCGIFVRGINQSINQGV